MIGDNAIINGDFDLRSIAPATLNVRGSTTWFSMDGRATSAVASYCFADADI